MSVTELKTAIGELSRDDLEELMGWLETYQARLWDEQLEDDLDAGRLDAVLAEVDKEYESGLAKQL